MKRHVCLVYGGGGTEREVSILSSKAILKALLALGFKVTELDFDGDFIPNITKIKPDVVFNGMHGTYGEDGVLPTILDFLKIPYTHSGRDASIVGMNKSFAKEIAKTLGIPVLDSKIYTKNQILSGEFEVFSTSFLKPLSEGSTLGCIKFTKKDGLTEEDLSIIGSIDGNFFLIEEFCPGREVTIAILGEKVIGGVEIVPKSGRYDYASKYTKGATDYFVPPRVPDSMFAKLSDAASEMHNTIGALSVSRSDFLIKDDAYYFLEINTHPGFVETSLAPKVCAFVGISFEETVRFLVEDASFKPYGK